MATKKRHEPEPPASSRTTLLVLAAGGLAVAALVVWALTRTVETRTDNTASAPMTASTPAIPAPSPMATNSPLTATQTPATPFSQTAPAEDAHAAVPRISVEDLREQWKGGAVTVVDVRDDAAFAASHIPGSLHIPFARVEGEMSTLPKDKPIVLYCT
jgi:hypothetical protein